jgi:hypothetical protein
MMLDIGSKTVWTNVWMISLIECFSRRRTINICYQSICKGNASLVMTEDAEKGETFAMEAHHQEVRSKHLSQSAITALA